MAELVIEKTQVGSGVEIALRGTLTTATAPQLAENLKSFFEKEHNLDSLVFDVSKLSYISSAGLRIVRFASKSMESSGSFSVKGCNESVMEVFALTGFASVMDIS